MADPILDTVVNGTPEQVASLRDEAYRRDVEKEAKRQIYIADVKDEIRRQRQAAPAIDLLDEAAFDARPAAKWIVHGVILETGLGTIVGEPGSLKTFMALDLALSIASGHQTWLGRKLTRQGAVVYVVAEGQGRFKYRKHVWKQERGVTGTLPFYVIPRPIDLRDPVLMDAFIAAITQVNPVLVVFDTLSRCIPGAEENSAKEFGEAIAACNRVQQATGASVQLLHHPRKDGASSRGSSAALGAVESELWMKKTAAKDLFTLSVGKQKEGDDDLTITLKRKIVELANVFEDGEPVTSCVIEVASAGDVAKAHDALARRILECVANHPGIKKGDVSLQLGMKKSVVDGAIDTLIFDGDLTVTQGGRGNRAKCLHVSKAATAPNPTQGSMIP